MPPTRRTRSSQVLPPRAVASTSRPPPQPGNDLESLPLESIETVGSIVSAATLPPKYKIYVTLGPSDFIPTGAATRKRFLEGEEILSDGWRRDVHLEGELDELREKRERRSEDAPLDQKQGRRKDKGKGKAVEAKEAIWYTASMRFLCSCKLPRHRFAYKPSHLAPTARQLRALPPHPSPRQIPQIGATLRPWASAIPALDLDPALDEMPEFELAWRDADGGWGKAWSCEPLGNGAGPSRMQTVHDAPAAVADRKGKGRAMIRADASLPSKPVAEASKGQAAALLEKAFDVSSPALDSRRAALSWEEEAKRRKAYWRSVIRSDEGYGQMWSVIPLPHTHPLLPPAPPPTKPASALIPADFVLPKAYFLSIPHPYHPNLPRYILKSPRSRLYWLIPVHGPVLVPGLNDPAALAITPGDTPRPDASSGKTAITTPSCAILSNRRRDISSVRPAPLQWTPHLLRHVWDRFLLPLQRDPACPLGLISLALSSPKPDPFIALKPPSPLSKHLFSRSEGPDKQGIAIAIHARNDQLPAVRVATSGGVVHSLRMAPVRPEAGDHIRLYCDAEHALKVRTWLYGIEVDLAWLEAKADALDGASTLVASEMMGGRSRSFVSGAVGAGSSTSVVEGAKGKAARRETKIFDRVRLALIGPRGEVLIVA